MFLRAKIKCPQCQGVRCRTSRWLSVEEKKKFPRCQPYRCVDCGHRFLLTEEAVARQGRVVSVPLAALAIVAAVALTLILTRPGQHVSVARTETTVATLDPEVKIAAEAGDAGAQYRLAEALLQQPGHTPEESAKAMRWLTLAAENGNTEAMIVLGRLSRTGVGTLQNFGQSAKWLQTAAARGNPEGMLELGRLYRDGIGVDKDPVRAYIWFNRASAVRNLDAVRERELISRLLTPEQLNEAQNLSSAPDTNDVNPVVKEKAPDEKEKMAAETVPEGQEKPPAAREKKPAAKHKK